MCVSTPLWHRHADAHGRAGARRRLRHPEKMALPERCCGVCGTAPGPPSESSAGVRLATCFCCSCCRHCLPLTTLTVATSTLHCRQLSFAQLVARAPPGATGSRRPAASETPRRRRCARRHRLVVGTSRRAGSKARRAGAVNSSSPRSKEAVLSPLSGSASSMVAPARRAGPGLTPPGNLSPPWARQRFWVRRPGSRGSGKSGPAVGFTRAQTGSM